MSVECNPLNLLQTALRARKQRTQTRNEQSSTTQSLRDRVAKLQNENKLLSKAECDDAGLRELDGQGAAPLNVKRRKRLEEIESESASSSAAITLSLDRQEEFARSLAEAEQNVADHGYSYTVASKHAAANAIKAGLNALAPQLAAMAAADKILARLTQSTPSIAPGDLPDDFSGDFVAHKLRKGLTFYVRPASLEDASFAAAVQAEVDRMSYEIEEGV